METYKQITPQSDTQRRLVCLHTVEFFCVPTSSNEAVIKLIHLNIFMRQWDVRVNFSFKSSLKYFPNPCWHQNFYYQVRLVPEFVDQVCKLHVVSYFQIEISFFGSSLINADCTLKLSSIPLFFRNVPGRKMNQCSLFFFFFNNDEQWTDFKSKQTWKIHK